MRSGFLNTCTSETPTSTMEKEKGSRNKRKYRTDHQHPQQHHSVASILPNGESSKNGVILDSPKNGVILDGNFCNNSSHTTDPSAFVPGSNGCCSYGHHLMLPNHFNHPSNPKTPEYPPTVDCRLKTGAFSMSPQHIPYPKHGKEYPELHDDSDWDRFSETQLEEILMSMLDAVYKDAIQKITASCDCTHDEALNAVLRSGRWNGRDALASIVESSLAWLLNKEARTTIIGDPSFTDLKQMESYVLSEMICMVRKVRIHMSRGDAMWCLLMCDLNVYLACAMDEDGVPSTSVKDRVVPNVMQSAVSSSDSSLINTPQCNSVASIPLPEGVPQVIAQSSTPFKSSQLDACSAFSTPNFSSSSVGKVSVASRKGSSKQSLSKCTRAPVFTSKSNEVKSTQANISQNAGVPTAYQFSLPKVPPLEDNAKNPGFYPPESNNKFEYIDKLQSWQPQPDHVVPSVTTSDISPQGVRIAQVPDTLCVPHCLELDSDLNNSLSFQTSVQQTSAIFRGSNKVCSSVQIQPISNPPVQTDLQIGRPSVAPFTSFQGSYSDSWTTPTTPVASTGAEISSTTSSIGNAGKESSGNSQTHDFNKDITSLPAGHGSSGSSKLLDCVDANDEERKTVMLWQLVDRVKCLESQHQDWTDWAQQKVMQAARRLTKDSAELKALRQERDVYIRLKKEKQALEESTMKKLAEMENALRKAVSQVDRANSTAWRLEAENAAVRSEMEAAKYAAAVSVSECQEASKREKKSTKNAQGWEKQKIKLQEDLLEGKKNLSSHLEQLSLQKERLQQIEARYLQENLALNDALLKAEAEKSARERSEELAKKREETMQKKYEAESQSHRDDVKKLEKEIAKVKVSLGLQPSPLSWENNSGISPGKVNACSTQKLKTMHAKLLLEIAEMQKSQDDVRRDRECVMCMSEEVSVVFLPCSHQNVCAKCNELHIKAGLGDCPSCRTPIKRRILVYGARS